MFTKEKTMRLHGAETIIVITLLLLVSLPSSSKAGIPSDQVRQTADKVLLILQNARLKAEDKKQERLDQLRQVISARFDFNEMAKRALGQHWQRRSAEEQRQFVRLFTDLLWRSYADQIESFNGEKIVYGHEQQDKDYSEVDTKVVTKKGEEFSINYRLHAVGSEWKVYDVVIENISLVNNYRSQFNHILANSSFDELLRKLQAKTFNAPENDRHATAASKA
jgi:phospholipid transport system substrate-binding protein